ncbi:tyrosine-type recombinase/integrase [Sporolactobacillus terrae]|uniref:tyrosine-type recombinase/integrase n=1 Tax=Sporolactobacillus terrae TaxID=269673 RepID=UPI00048A5396|nr:tyrosine-type recombinase/integrase [Sporolactobacillus terrae]
MPSFQKYDTKQGKRWLFKLDLGIDPKTGKRRTTTRRGFLRKPDAMTACAKFQQMIKDGAISPDRDITIIALSEKWINAYSMGKNKEQTIVARRTQLKHITDAFGYLKAREITHFMYQTFIYGLKDKGKSENTIKGIHAAGSMLFKFAAKEKIIYENPTNDIDMPVFPIKLDEVEDIENSYLEKDEVEKFLESMKRDKRPDMHEFFLILIWTGFRIGELIALKWKDVDFANRDISVNRTYVSTTKGTSLPKTKSSIRKINVEPEVINALNRQKTRIRIESVKYPVLRDNELVFPRMEGKNIGKLYSERIIQYAMEKSLERANIEKELTPHKLRHTHASLLAEAGVSLDDIKARLGHQDDEITARIYTHVTKSRRRSTSEKFGKLMRENA